MLLEQQSYSLASWPGEMAEHNGFVSDGNRRARKGVEAEVREAVEARYADQWNAAGILRRFALRRQIENEIERQIALKAPPDALY